MLQRGRPAQVLLPLVVLSWLLGPGPVVVLPQARMAVAQAADDPVLLQPQAQFLGQAQPRPQPKR